MKRYSTFITADGDAEMRPYDDGDWVRFEDAQDIQAHLDMALVVIEKLQQDALVCHCDKCEYDRLLQREAEGKT